MIITISEQDYSVEYVEDPFVIENDLTKDKPHFFTYDTETTGLHIKKDKPFLGAVCWNNKVYVFPATFEILSRLVNWSRKVKRVYMHNATFDLHMTANVIGDKTVSNVDNVGDTMALARLSFQAISAGKEGGDSIGLKEIGKKYIDKDANKWEKEVKNWIKGEKARRRKILLTMLKPFKILATFVDAHLKKDLPFDNPDVQEIVDAWKEEYPPVTYQDVPMDIMLPYVAVDVILTKIWVLMALPVVVQRKQVEVMNREFRLLKTVFKMERQGLAVDFDYLDDCAVKMKKMMDVLYDELHELTGIEDLKVGQNAKIKKLYEEWLEDTLQSSNKKFLKKMSEKYKESKEGRVATIISELRRLDKWLSTYIVRIKKVAEYDGRFYGQLNQFGPVSGRFKGDAQQFPKKATKDHEGKEIFHPRRAFLGNLYYLD